MRNEIQIVMFVLVVFSTMICWISTIVEFVLKRINFVQKGVRVNNLIKVVRKDKTIRYVSIVIDRATNKYRFVNLTKGHNHICQCSFDSYNDAIEDLHRDPNVIDWDYI